MMFAVRAYSQTEDSLACAKVFSLAIDRHLAQLPIGEVMTAVAGQFIGRPYEAHTLDRGKDERLVVNLRSFDCVTLVENTLALSRCIKAGRCTMGAFTEELRRIRYRGGAISGYASRLHYFADWISDNEKRGTVRDVTRDLGGVSYRPLVNFMTMHRKSYPLLEPDSVYEQLKSVERSLATLRMFYLPKSDSVIAGGNPGHGIRSGDIIAITTTVPGLDISHTGIAYRDGKGILRYLHAPDVGETVTITNETLAEYLRRHKSQSGILVVRPEETGP